MRRFLALQWLLLCSAADVQVVDMYRALKKPSGGEEGDQRLENNNLADILGVLRYLHQEVVVEHAVGDPERTERKYGIDAIARYRVTLKNPTKLDASSSIMGFSPKFSAFDYGIATNPDTLKELAEVGDFVGIQKKDPFVDASMAVSYPYYWFSLPGKCPNLPWTCLKGSNHADCTHTDEEVGVLPVSCKDVGCAGKSDEEAAQCKADFETPETLQDCCLKYTGPSFSNKLRKAVLKGGLCPMGKNPTGQPGCVYNYEPLVEKDYVNLEDLIQAVDGPLKCGSNGERTCENWNDWRRNCHDPEKKYKRKFQQAYLADGRMDVKIVETEHCVEYDLNPFCQDTPPHLCLEPACVKLPPEEKEIGLTFWRGRCDEQWNIQRAEAVAKAFFKEDTVNHVLVDKELLTNNPKCATVCKPNTNGGPYCSRQFGGVCSQCYIPGTKDPFHDPEHFPTCPFDVLEEGGYSVPAGTECKSNRASDICCLYNVNGPCSKTFTDGSNIDLDMEGFLGVSKTAKEDPAQMLTFAKRWVEEEKGGKLNDEELFGKEVFRLWRIHPPKHPEEAWEFFQDSLKASKAVDYDAPTEEPPTPEPAGPGPSPPAPPAPPSPKPKPSEPGTNWSVIFAVLAAAALVMVFLFMYRDTRRRQAAARGSYMEEGDGRALQMSRM